MIQSPSDTQPSLRPCELSVCSPGIQSAFQGPSWCPFGCPLRPGQDLNLSGGLLAATPWTPPGSQLARCSGCSWYLCCDRSGHPRVSTILGSPGLSVPSRRHIPGFLSVPLQLMWMRGRWSLTGWRPQVRDLPVAVSTGPYGGHLLGFSGAAGAAMWLDSPGRSSWGDHGALSSPTTLQAHPLA